MYQYEWYGSLDSTFMSLGAYAMNFLPKLLIALLIILAGYIIASILRGIVQKIINSFPVNNLLQSAGVTPLVERSGYTLNVGKVFGTLVKWFVLTVFFIVALDVVGLNQASAFLYEIIWYLPRVIVATAILFIGITLAQVVHDVVVGTARTAKFSSPEILAKFARVVVIIFTVLAALNQLQIASELVQMFFGGLVFAISLAIGLAFGLGGKETAARYLDSLRKN